MTQSALALPAPRPRLLPLALTARSSVHGVRRWLRQAFGRRDTLCIHGDAVQVVAERIGELGLGVVVQYRSPGNHGTANPPDLIVDGRVTVAVRVCRRQSTSSTTARNSKRYTYHRSLWRWNLHSHGRVQIHPDFWVLLGAGATLVIPGRYARVKTVQVTCHPGREGWSKWRKFEDAWGAIGEAVCRRVSQQWELG